MVLSNKKLKQKLREAVNESLAASQEAKNSDCSSNPYPNLLTQQSLKALLGSAARRSRVRRREKRRKTLALEALNSGSEGKNGGTEKKVEAEGGGSEDLTVKTKDKKRKKRKRDDGRKSESVETGESVEVKKLSKKKKKDKKRKKKSMKHKGSDNGSNEASKELTPMEPAETSNVQETEEAATKVYVGGIPFYSTEDDIWSYFEGCGTITDIDCMKFPESGKFRGIAIISFKTDAAAKRALALNGSDMGGLFLKIMPYRSKRSKTSPDFAPSVVEGYNRIYVGNLSWDITEGELKKFFTGCNISSIRFGKDKETGEFRGYAHVDFADSLSLNMALKLNQEIVCGRPVRVRCAVPQKKKVTGGAPKESGMSEIGGDDESAKVNSVGEAVSGKIRRRTCYECGEKGHLSSSCPKKQAAADLAEEVGAPSH